MQIIKTSVRQRIGLIIFGFFLCIVLLEVGLRIGGFILLSIQEHRNRISLIQGEDYRIMCLGESTTFCGGKYSYPHQLEEILNQREPGVKFSIINKGLPAASTDTILSKLEDYLNRYKPDMVIAMMGINDRGKHIRDENKVIEKNAPLVESFRIYKLAKLIWLSTVNRAKELAVDRKSVTNSSVIYDKNQLAFDSKSVNTRSEGYIGLAKSFFEKGNFAKGEAILTQALETHPQDQQFYIALGRYYMNNGIGMYFTVDKILTRALEIHPQDYRPYLQLGWFYKSQEDYDQSVEMFKKTIEIDPSNCDAYFGLASVYEIQKKYAEAEKMFKKGMELAPNNSDAHLVLAKSYLEKGNFTKAEEILTQALERHPQEHKIYVQLGRYYILENKTFNFEEIVDRALEMPQDNDKMYFYLERCCQSQKDYSQGIKIPVETIEINTKKSEQYIQMGLIYHEKEDFARAEEVLAQALEMQPEKNKIYIGLGRCYISEPDLTNAETQVIGRYIELEQSYGEKEDVIQIIKETKKVENIFPDDEAYILLGLFYPKNKDFAKAEQMFKKAIEVAPTYYKGYEELGRCYWDKKEFAKAEVMFKKAIELNAKSAKLRRALALTYLEQGEKELAAKYFEEANSVSLEYDTQTRLNYQKLKMILNNKGIKLVCVQYPLRNVEPLKKMLEPNEDVIFVDNEIVFKKALERAKYEEYFMDMFGGDFGHCTRKGNRLLAENIADVILEHIQVTFDFIN